MASAVLDKLQKFHIFCPCGTKCTINILKIISISVVELRNANTHFLTTKHRVGEKQCEMRKKKHKRKKRRRK